MKNGERIVHGGRGKVVGGGTHGGPGMCAQSRIAVQFPDNSSPFNFRLSEVSRKPPPPLAGGLSLDNEVYYRGPTQMMEDGDRLLHRAKGVVLGAHPDHPGRVVVQFPGNKGCSLCAPATLSLSEPPETSGEFSPGDTIYYTGSSQTFSSGNKVEFGRKGEVMGAASEHVGRVGVQFEGNSSLINCLPGVLSHEPPPPLPGGYNKGDHVHFIGPNRVFDNGEKLFHGGRGEVMGPTTDRDPEHLAVFFPGNKASIECPLDCLSYDPPKPLDGGYNVGDQVYLTGPSQTFPDGDKVVHGGAGEVMGPATLREPDHLTVMFPGNKATIDCHLGEISREPPPPLPSGFALGDPVYFIGHSQTGRRGIRVVFGSLGEVLGPSDDNDPDFLAVLFPNNRAGVACRIRDLSREKPGPLPGPFGLGENLYFIGPSMAWDDGNKAKHGCTVEVVGPTKTNDDIAVQLGGSKDSIECPLKYLSRSPPPPLDGGFKLADKVYFTGKSEGAAPRDRLTHGSRGAAGLKWPPPCCLRTPPHLPPGLSKGSGRSYAPRSAARASWKLAMARPRQS
jgi:hypothetical protein